MPQEHLGCKTDAPINNKVTGSQNKLISEATKKESCADTAKCEYQSLNTEP